METKPPSAIEQFVRDLMPGRTGADIEEAVYNFMEYLKVVGEISERLEREGESLPTAEEIAVLE